MEDLEGSRPKPSIAPHALGITSVYRLGVIMLFMILGKVVRSTPGIALCF
jgi:hypothetical protein